MNIDYRYRSIEIDKEEKVVSSINIDDFPIEIDNDFFIDSYRLLSILLSDENRKIIFCVTSISIDFRYQSILIGGLNRLTSIDFRYRFLSINYVRPT